VFENITKILFALNYISPIKSMLKKYFHLKRVAFTKEIAGAKTPTFAIKHFSNSS